MYCTKCGNEIADNAFYCPSCGVQLDEDKEEQKTVNLQTEILEVKNNKRGVRNNKRFLLYFLE